MIKSRAGELESLRGKEDCFLSDTSVSNLPIIQVCEPGDTDGDHHVVVHPGGLISTCSQAQREGFTERLCSLTTSEPEAIVKGGSRNGRVQLAYLQSNAQPGAPWDWFLGLETCCSELTATQCVLYTSTRVCLSFSYFQDVRLRVLQRGDLERSHHLAECELDLGEPVMFGRNSPALETTAIFSTIQTHHHHILLCSKGPVGQ